ncbi:BlaI/MecI/CopY family transcriptional regulator [Streptomyces sp. 5-6(2022)]|uniref:BlaI/MecI/CopY family transcriptional regulator n=1 Tax=Streptomyces sp. 5-6(2022) TaxID=2936510 RepID=UPI0023B9D900|nr:BlaI/MecI/CopY family transcriptional regulator [Streptomyces sp. 5-6(2022)]
MDTPADSASLKSQYAAQVAADLERNSAEQERLRSDIAALQEQLAVLEDNRALLLSMRQTLGGDAAGDATENGEAGGSGDGSSAKREVATLSATRKARKKANAAGGKRKGAESVGSRPRRQRVREAGVPTLRELVRDALAQHGEPRSAAEVTAALSQTFPEREIKPTVVRSTLESLVAKGQAHRTKQQKSVFYSAVTTDAATTDAAADAGEPSEARAS